ncbi:MFS transporter [Actinoallomurus oryzae]|uniref:MFS transporter n=1 Tax=Actinoallomurus oryzae TaxID=502180 RepID=UPI003CD09FC1
MAGAATRGADAGGADHSAAGGTDPGEAQPRLSLFRSLHNRNYRLFSAGQVVSNTGTWMQRVAQDWLVLNLTHGSGTALGITTGLQFLPLLLFGLYGGVIADRFPKRRILMITQLAMGMLALVLGVLALTGSAQVWHVYALAFGLGVLTVVDNPTRQTFAVEMVGPNDLSNAIALNSAIFNTARILGPAIAGVLIAAIGTGPVFIVNAASYLAVLLGLYLMRDEELYIRPRVPRAKGQLREGLRYVRDRRDLVMLLIVLFFVAAFGMNFQMTTALMSREVFHSGAGSFGLASTMLAVGAVSGSLLSARRKRPRMRLMLIAAAAFGVLEIVSGAMPTYILFLVALIPTGVALLTFNTTANAVMQLSVPSWMRGRVMGLYMLVFAGSSPIGAPLLGWLAEVFGPRSGLIIGGIVSLAAVTVVVAIMAPRSALNALRPRVAETE